MIIVLMPTCLVKDRKVENHKYLPDPEKHLTKQKEKIDAVNIL